MDLLKVTLANAVVMLIAASIPAAIVWLKLRTMQMAKEVRDLEEAEAAEERRKENARKEVIQAEERKRANEAAIHAAQAAESAARHAAAEVAQVKVATEQTKQEQAAQVQEVKETLLKSTSETTAALADLKTTTDIIHAATNSGLGRVLRVAAIALRRTADDHHNPADVAAAEAAEKELNEHEESQKVALALPTLEDEDRGSKIEDRKK